VIVALGIRHIFIDVPKEFYSTLSTSLLFLLANSYFQDKYSRKIYSMFKNMQKLENEK
jgi:hypothetical protein